MPRYSTFRHYNLNESQRRVLTVASFGGVDFSGQKFNVATNHAIDLLNFVYRDGVIQKRFGYEQLNKIKPFKYVVQPFDNFDIKAEVKTNTCHFNGLWKFLAEDGKEHVIAHIGKLLYEFRENNSFIPITVSSVPNIIIDLNSYYTCYEYEDYRSFAFVGSNRLWFLGGNKYMCIRYEKNENKVRIETVDNSQETFIPTTTISITCKNALISRRESLDKTNLLTYWRKNQLLSGIGKNEDSTTKTEYYEYTLDTPLLTKNTNLDMSRFSLIIEERGSN